MPLVPPPFSSSGALLRIPTSIDRCRRSYGPRLQEKKLVSAGKGNPSGEEELQCQTDSNFDEGRQRAGLLGPIKMTVSFTTLHVPSRIYIPT